MAYRSGDPSEQELREQRTRLRREHDELQERADALALRLTESSGGVLTAIKNLIGGMSEEEITLARVEHAELEAKIATLATSERDVDAQLARIDASRAEHAAGDAARIDAARAAAGPLGDQLRAIAAERDVTSARLARFDTVIKDSHHAGIVVDELAGGDTSSVTASVVKAVHNTAGVLTLGDVHTGDREAREARRSSHVELACARIKMLLDGFAGLAHAWPDPKPIELASRQLASMTTQAFDIASARSCLERLDHAVVAERDALARTLAQLDDRERELVR